MNLQHLFVLVILAAIGNGHTSLAAQPSSSPCGG